MVEMKERDMENVTETHKMNQERSYDGETNCKRIILKGSRKEGTDTPVNRIEMKRKWNERTAETDRQSTGLLHTSPLSAFCPSVNESVNPTQLFNCGAGFSGPEFFSAATAFGRLV